MEKYIAKMNDGADFDYSLEAKDLFEADSRAQHLAEQQGWKYREITVAHQTDVQHLTSQSPLGKERTEKIGSAKAKRQVNFYNRLDQAKVEQKGKLQAAAITTKELPIIKGKAI
ncbi:hypothetical protein ACFO26_05920 [Lactococcus nasutitermitis]|uniref:Uncharacterized protein n=1 Tax=Lactococcus nasutitermitis TaxID=1652957 RepID=A0ABV9JDR4_9LACT|nr:hypothetical protein [Lactococcus nasutitermitis]